MAKFTNCIFYNVFGNVFWCVENAIFFSFAFLFVELATFYFGIDTRLTVGTADAIARSLFGVAP